MKTRTVSVDIRVPEISDDMRSSAMAVAGIAVIGGICALVAVRALTESDAYSSPGAGAVGVLGAAAVLVSVLRWVPSLREESMRSVPRRYAAMLLAACIALGGVAITSSAWRDPVIGVLPSLCLLNVYLACWGYRSMYLLRRVVLFSVLSWPVVASSLFEFVGRSLRAPSDLIFRRLSSLDFASASDHPWRVLSAMTGHATVAVVGVVILTIAASRLRLSVPAVARLVIGSTLAMVLQHTLVLSARIESYGPSWWAGAAASPVIELVIAAIVAAGLFSSASALTSDDHASSPSPDRDPEIFGLHNIAMPVRAMRLCSL
ncbi:MAG TPA: hypothetical protein VFV63_08970, partial [Ilumatobacteraceae bacterium]|nr:hypothetical protein [Ilumatobacteraceae bacterium]